MVYWRIVQQVQTKTVLKCQAKRQVIDRFLHIKMLKHTSVHITQSASQAT